MSETKIDQEGLFFFQCFAWPCAAEKLKCEIINEEQYEALRSSIVQSKKPVPLDFFEKCYPKVIAKYRKHCDEQKIEADFSRQSVIDFLERTHSDRGYCSLKTAVVCLRDNVNNIVGVCEGKTDTYENPFGLRPGRTSHIYVHRKMVVGIVD